MHKRELKRNNKRVISLLIFLVSVACVTGFIHRHFYLLAQQKNQLLVQGVFTQAQAYFNSLIIDYEMLKNTLPIHAFTQLKSNSTQQKLTEFLFEYIKSRRSIIQIRVLSSNGQEIYRIDNKNGVLEKVPSHRLQNKSSRYYFKEAALLKKNEIYISPIDLNIENGKVEMPQRLVIRLASKIYQADRKYSGILIVNFSPNDLLELFTEHDAANGGELMLLDGKGNYIYPARRYSISTNADPFSSLYKDEWNKIANQASGQFFNKTGRLISSKKVEVPFSMESAHLAISSNQRSWYIVNRL